MTLRRALTAFVVACSLVAGRADAQNAAASAAAEKLFREGKALYAAGNVEQAIEKFRASQELEPSVGVLLSLGDAYRARGAVASAWSAYVAARDLAKAKGDARASDAEERAADVRARVPHLTIRVVSPADVTVSDNGLALPPASLGSSLPVDPGPHAIVATAKGRRPFRATTELAEGQSREVVVPALEIEPLASAPAGEDERSGAQRTTGTVLLVGGGAFTIAGLAFGTLAITKWRTVTDACPAQQCDSAQTRAAALDDAHTASRYAVVSTVGVVVGLVALGAGLVVATR